MLGLDAVRVIENALGTFIGALLFALGAGIVGAITLTAVQVLTSIVTLVVVVVALLAAVSATRSAWVSRTPKGDDGTQGMTAEELAAMRRLDDSGLSEQEREEASAIVAEAARRVAADPRDT